MSIYKNNRLLLIIFFALLTIDIILIAYGRKKPVLPYAERKTWAIESIDTVKYSRDPAREYAKDEDFDAIIDKQVAAIASTGASYIGLGTPYDKEFIPYLKRWVDASRKHGLKIWFRGNFSGWEEWFGYPPINREEHKEMLKSFILNNGYLFDNGDLFTSCTECENGGPGDPRRTRDVEEYRKFLIDEYDIARGAFRQINKDVSANYFPMNYDVAKLIMNKETTKLLGGVVTIDHYVNTPEYLIQSIKELEQRSEGKIFLGEFGAPIPDIHGSLSDKEQADWIKRSLTELAKDENIIGVNYWTATGGSTRIWKEDGSPTPAVEIIKSFYSPKTLAGVVQNEAGRYIKNAIVKSSIRSVKTGPRGEFMLTYLNGEERIKLSIEAPGYESKELDARPTDTPITLTLNKQSENIIFKMEKFLYKILKI